MTTLGISNQEKINRMPFHRRNDSDELDVFDASSYFSCTNDVFSYKDTNLAQKNIQEEKQGSRGGRISLDMPLMRNPIPQPQSHKKETNTKEKKNYKPPSSPGGKLASFLNSLFSQTSSKKKMSKTMSHSMRDKDENSGGRKRRSSISNFGSSFSKDTKFSTNSTISGFRTPPPNCVNGMTYTKYNSSHSDIGAPYVIKPSSLQNIEAINIKEFKFITKGTLEKPMKNNWIYEKNKGGNKNKKFDEVDDGGESDSSSDLFELENHGLGHCSSGLPVYETTHLGNIKRGPPISNGAVY